MCIALCSILCAPLFSASVPDLPKPYVQGPGSSFMGGKQGTNMTLQSVKIKLPAGWGIGATSMGQGGGYATLVPMDGGIGCRVEVKEFGSEEEAQTELAAFKKKYPKSTPIPGGFEVNYSKGWVAFRAEKEFLVHFVYSVPKMTKECANNWVMFKEGVSCIQRARSWKQDPSKPFSLTTYAPDVGWWCHHPNNKMHVLLESLRFPIGITSNTDPEFKHLLKICENHPLYFFVQWDVEALDTTTPYEMHLTQMMEEVIKLEPKQVFANAPDLFPNNQKCALRDGSPYVIVTVEGDGFLYGFAFNKENIFARGNLDRYLNSIKWVKE